MNYGTVRVYGSSVKMPNEKTKNGIDKPTDMGTNVRCTIRNVVIQDQRHEAEEDSCSFFHVSLFVRWTYFRHSLIYAETNECRRRRREKCSR